MSSITVRVDHFCGDWFTVLIIAEGMHCIFQVGLSMAFGNRQWLGVHHTKPSTLGWSVVVGSNRQGGMDS